MTRRERRPPPAHYNPPPRFGLRLFVDWVRADGTTRRFIDHAPRAAAADPWEPRGPGPDTFAATRRFQRFLGAHLQIDGWGYP